MRERFQLACKLLGTTLICLDLVWVATIAAVAFGASLSGPEVEGLPQVAEMQARMARQLLIQALVSSAAGLTLGFHLTRDENLFVRICYPA